MTAPPQDMVDYLLDLISPPDERAVHYASLDEIDWAGIKAMPENHLCGMLVRGTPTDEQSAELLRVMKPGAHLLLIAPEQQPTGHTGACRIEDAGFEIRDTIFWARDPDSFCYMPKASRSEREKGCWVEPVSGAEAVDRKEGTAGLNNPRAGAGRTASQVANRHPTVKPIGIMEHLLSDVPKDAHVIDPFLGSGTTGIAAVHTGHTFTGIEREEEYLRIADSRVRSWAGDRKAAWTRAIEIESEVEPVTFSPAEDDLTPFEDDW